MSVDLKARKIARFRCHIDPMVGHKPKNAFDRRDMPNAEFELTPAGVYIRLQISGPPPTQTVSIEEHLIPFANIQSIKLEPLEK